MLSATAHARAPRRGVWWPTVAGLAVCGLVLSSLVTGCAVTDRTDRASAPAPAPPAPLSGVPSTVPDIVARVEPSIVTVLADPGLGSGVVYKDGGIVITNAHVVGQRKRVELALADGSRVPAEVTATDQTTDLAVLRAERTDLPPARFRPELPRVGELVVAMGSPLGFTNSATAGIISGLGRSIPGSARADRALVDLIQTDAAISPGNSGGGLLDSSGAVVGINEAYIPPELGAVALGFAIPAATVTETVDELLADGTASHPFLGVSVGRVTTQIAEALGLDSDEGVLVLATVADGPAARAGLRPGDVITALDGDATRTVEDFLGSLRRSQPGQQAVLDIRRDGRSQRVTVTVGELKS
jgi:serine protease Do